MAKRKPEHPKADVAKKVRRLRLEGTSRDSIATLCGISHHTLTKHYHVELGEIDDTRQALTDEKRMRIAEGVVDRYLAIAEGRFITDKSASAVLIFLGKTILGLRETAPVHDRAREIEELTDDELRAIVAARARRSRGDSASPKRKAKPS